MMYTVEVVSRENINGIDKLKVFLRNFNLEYDDDIDYSVILTDNGKLIGTASKSLNVLKCFAVLEEYQGFGIANTLIKAIEDQMFREGRYHFFIYTLTNNKSKFLSIGYKEIISTLNITILENGIFQIENYLQEMKSQYGISNNKKACIIMNANPFTLGHRFLIEQASRENSEVIIFIVSEEKSNFPFSVRFQLVKEGVKDLNNVQVIETGPYLISHASFPTYFLKQKTNTVSLHAKIDCEIFLKYYQPIFNITTRYVGDEPLCPVTNIYNQTLLEMLPKNGVLVKVIKRKEINNEVISASLVRRLLQEKAFEKLKLLVPVVTYNYLVDSLYGNT